MLQLSQPAGRTTAMLPGVLMDGRSICARHLHSRSWQARFRSEGKRSSALLPPRKQGIRFFTNQPDNKPTSSRSGDSLDSYQIGVQEDEVKRYQGEMLRARAQQKQQLAQHLAQQEEQNSGQQEQERQELEEEGRLLQAEAQAEQALAAELAAQQQADANTQGQVVLEQQSATAGESYQPLQDPAVPSCEAQQPEGQQEHQQLEEAQEQAEREAQVHVYSQLPDLKSQEEAQRQEEEEEAEARRAEAALVEAAEREEQREQERLHVLAAKQEAQREEARRQAEWREKLRVLQQRLAAVGQEVALASRQTVPAVAALRDDKALSRASPVPVPHKQEDIVLAAVAAATGPTQVTSSTAGYVQVGLPAALMLRLLFGWTSGFALASLVAPDWVWTSLLNVPFVALWSQVALMAAGLTMPIIPAVLQMLRSICTLGQLGTALGAQLLYVVAAWSATGLFSAWQAPALQSWAFIGAWVLPCSLMLMTSLHLAHRMMASAAPARPEGPGAAATQRPSVMGAVKKAASLATGAVSFLVPRNLQSLTYLLLSLGAMAAGFLLYSDKLQELVLGRTLLLLTPAGAEAAASLPAGALSSMQLLPVVTPLAGAPLSPLGQSASQAWVDVFMADSCVFVTRIVVANLFAISTLLMSLKDLADKKLNSTPPAQALAHAVGFILAACGVLLLFLGKHTAVLPLQWPGQVFASSALLCVLASVCTRAADAAKHSLL